MEYLVSVVVPTKNRYKYLKNLIRLIDGFHLDEMELVIQDNSDDNTEILEYLKEFSNSNIHYYYSTNKLTMSTNADEGIRNAKGEYVCYIGDDDGVCRNIVDCVKWMKENGIDGAKTAQTIFYYNENIEKKSDFSFRKAKPKARIENTKDRLEQAVNRGLVLSDCYLPMVYQSIVKKSVLDKIYERGGTHFPGVVPDISGAVCLCFELQRFAVLEVPVVINGLSRNAGGGVFTKNEKGLLPLEDVPFITQKARDEWDKRLPRIWYGVFVWTEAGIKALEYMNSSLSKTVNIDYSIARAIRYCPEMKKEFSLFCSNRFYLSYWIIWQKIRRLWKAIIRRTFKGSDSVKKIGLDGIIECEAFLLKNVTQINFKDIVISE